MRTRLHFQMHESSRIQRSIYKLRDPTLLYTTPSHSTQGIGTPISLIMAFGGEMIIDEEMVATVSRALEMEGKRERRTCC